MVQMDRNSKHSNFFVLYFVYNNGTIPKHFLDVYYMLCKSNNQFVSNEAVEMKVIFRSKDFASITSGGLGFNNRRPGASPWRYQGRVQHRDWQGTYECLWEGVDAETGNNTMRRTPPELVWTVSGDARLFRLAAALKSQGYVVTVEQDDDHDMIASYAHAAEGHRADAAGGRM